ncbi:hypothetical protein [Nocardia brasiliensis]|uniref:hypothetical protein n=1 Tax=Nocardia brasiliensis TaxID=37326 RepID=UPI00245577F0|nr:hypothetical protein [Nocardia brasiliensis]
MTSTASWLVALALGLLVLFGAVGLLAIDQPWTLLTAAGILFEVGILTRRRSRA